MPGVIRGYGSALAIRAKVLAGIEAETGQPARAPNLDATAPYAMGLGRVFDDLEVMVGGQPLNFGQVGSSSVEVNGDDRARFRCEDAFGRSHIQVEGGGVDVGEDGSGADVAHRFGCGEEAVCGDNHLIVGTDAGRLERQLQRRRSRADAHRVLGADKPSEFVLKPLDPLSPDEVAGLQNGLHSLLDFFLDRHVLGF